MPKKLSAELERDVVRVARCGDLSLAEVAADFDISVESLHRWVRRADIDDGVVDGYDQRAGAVVAGDSALTASHEVLRRVTCAS